LDRSFFVLTRIREVRKGKGLTLSDVAERCKPPTTPQTVGRLETGTRTVSVGWLNRIAAALGVDAAELVTHPERPDIPVAALLDAEGAAAPTAPRSLVPPRPAGTMIAVQVTGAVGDYRAGDALWCERLGPEDFPRARNRDVLVPRPAGRFAFGRLVDMDGSRLALLPLTAGARQSIIPDAPWLAVASVLVRTL
jgi:transcriptional regulator with XRE-family HTH domain